MFPVPQVAPSQVEGYNTSSTSIHVTWFPLNKSQVKGILTSYIVRYAPFDDSANVTDNQQVSVPVAETSIELDGLKKYTSYSITVSGATTDAGLESYPIIIKTSEDSKSINIHSACSMLQDIFFFFIFDLRTCLHTVCSLIIAFCAPLFA